MACRSVNAPRALVALTLLTLFLCSASHVIRPEILNKVSRINPMDRSRKTHIATSLRQTAVRMIPSGRLGDFAWYYGEGNVDVRYKEPYIFEYTCPEGKIISCTCHVVACTWFEGQTFINGNTGCRCRNWGNRFSDACGSSSYGADIVCVTGWQHPQIMLGRRGANLDPAIFRSCSCTHSMLYHCSWTAVVSILPEHEPPRRRSNTVSHSVIQLNKVYLQ